MANECQGQRKSVTMQLKLKAGRRVELDLYLH